MPLDLVNDLCQAVLFERANLVVWFRLGIEAGSSHRHASRWASKQQGICRPPPM